MPPKNSAQLTISLPPMTGGERMTVLEQMNHFSNRFGKEVIVNGTTWR